MTKVTIHVAKTNLSKLIAKVEAGEEVVICRGDEEVVRMVPAKAANDSEIKRRRGRGLLKGVAESENFFEPWTPEDLGLGPDWDSE